MLLSPVRRPLYAKLSTPKSLTITPEKVDSMNAYLHEISTNERADIIWSFAAMTEEHEMAYSEDGTHLAENVASRQADILLNARCNWINARSGGYPYNRTCCSNYRPSNWTQRSISLVCFILLPLIRLATTTSKDILDLSEDSSVTLLNTV